MIMPITKQEKKSFCQTTRVAMPMKDGLRFILIEDIYYCQSNGNFVTLHLKNGKSFIASKSMKKMEELLTAHYFFRIHHQYLVNTAEIVQYEKGDGGNITLINGVIIPVSRYKKAEFLNMMLHGVG